MGGHNLIRLHVISEGQTEEAFTKNILAPELGLHNIVVDTHRVTTGRHRGVVYRGGLTRYEQLARDIELWMKQDQHAESWFTTMVDYYRLPIDFPGQTTVHHHLPAHERCVELEAELSRNIAARLEGIPVSSRFIPYIQLHEFEALLFSDVTAFLESFPDADSAVRKLKSIRAQFPSPEHINNDPATTPCQRILDVLPGYQKPVAGVLIAKRIGLDSLRKECSHFNEWVTRLFKLSTNNVCAGG